MSNWFESIFSDCLPSRAVTVYLYLTQRANAQGQCWPSERRIAKDLSMSKSTVRRAVEDLKQGGYLHTEQRYRKTGAKSSLLFTVKGSEFHIGTTKG